MPENSKIEYDGVKYDVIIIGSGSVGAPAAFYLAQAGYRVLVLDGAPSVGQGSNKRAIGGVRATHSDPAKIRLCLRSIEIFRTWQETYGEDIEWITGGYNFVAYRPEEEQTLKTLLAKQKSLGLNIDWYDKNDLLKIVPGLNPVDLLGGTYSPEDGNCSPLLALHAFYVHACQEGAVFHYNEPVTGLVIQSGKIRGVQTPHGEYGAEVVINAAGAWARSIGLMAGIDLPVNPDCHEAGITESVAQFLGPMVVDIRPGPWVIQLLLLPAQDRADYLLHHAQPIHLGFRRGRDGHLPATDFQAHDRGDAQAAEHPRAAHLARSLPHDPGRHAHCGLGQRGGRAAQCSRHVRAGLYARPRHGRAAGAHGGR